MASVFISRWDAAVVGKVPESLNDRLGIAIAQRTYKAYRQLLSSPRWQRVYNAGARPQRLLWASTGTKDPKASDILYIKALAAPFTVNTMPESTLKAFAEHGEVGPILAADGGDCETMLTEFAKAGIDIDALAARLQDEGAKSFVKSWNELMVVIASKSAALGRQLERLNEWKEYASYDRLTPQSTDLTSARPGRPSKPTIKKIQGLHLREPFRGRSQARRADDGSRLRASSSITRRTASPTRRSSCCCNWRRSPACAARIDAMFRGREDQRHGKPRRAARGPARAERDIHRRGWRERRARGPRRARQDGGLLPTACAAGRGRATPASAFATSSTSASAAPTSGR